VTLTFEITEAINSKFADGVVPSGIYSSPQLHEIEQRAVFGKAWLFVGHESMIPEPGNFITTYMGEDSVVLVRDRSRGLRVLLNKCRHRGNKVCLFDRGKTHAFTCSYHGWTYGLDGALKGVPQVDTAYQNALNQSSLGLHEARCESYGGLIFATWSDEAPSLEEYLGDLRWYLDNLFLMDDLGGLEVVPGKQRHTTSINWKLMAESFVGDHYHFAVTHASLLSVLADMDVTPARALGLETKDTAFEVTINAKGFTHSVGSLLLGPQYLEEDLRQAKSLGPDAVDWVRARHDVLTRRLKGLPEIPYGFNRFHVFPNLSMVHATSALTAHTLLVWNPRGPVGCEPWQWCAVPKGAPEVVKKAALQAIIQGQSVAGMIGTDDSENFTRISDNVKSTMGKAIPFDYTMGLGFEGKNHPAIAGRENLEAFPGQLGYHTSEVSQRAFLRCWAELIQGEIS
jgi:phenylpropionate dioxygenase-like ring-hydroxylating dioxygenase large terminal subunit